MASAMGERTEFCEQANRTLAGMSAIASAPDMQDADQGEEPAGRIEIDFDLAP